MQLLDYILSLELNLLLFKQDSFIFDQLDVLYNIYPSSPEISLVHVQEVFVAAVVVDVLGSLNEGFELLALVLELRCRLLPVFFHNHQGLLLPPSQAVSAVNPEEPSNGSSHQLRSSLLIMVRLSLQGNECHSFFVHRLLEVVLDTHYKCFFSPMDMPPRIEDLPLLAAVHPFMRPSINYLHELSVLVIEFVRML